MARAKENQARLDALKSAMIRDVSTRDLTDKDIAAMELHTEAQGGEVTAYLYRVETTQGSVLTYRIDSNGAISCNGVVLGVS